MSDLHTGGDDAAGIERRRVLGVAAAGVAAAVAGCGGSGTNAAGDDTEPGADDDQDRDLTVPTGFQTYRENLQEAGNLEKASEGVRGDPQLTGNDIQNMLEEAETVQDELQFLVQNTETHYLNEAMKEYSAQKQDTDSYVIGNTTFGSFPGANEDISEFIVVENGEIQGVHGNNAFWGQQQGEYTRQNGGHDALQALYNPEKAASTVPEDIEGIRKKFNHLDGRAEEHRLEEFIQNMYSGMSMTIPGVGREVNLRFGDMESGVALYEAKYGEGDGEIIRELSEAYSNIDNPESFDSITAEYDAGWNLNPENNAEPTEAYN
jgi:hypothetical protein